jgi:putative ABC transport system ATP-binding protein
MKKAVIRTEKIRKVYLMGDIKVEALKGVDIEIREGEMVAIIGPSGCGKSTLLQILGLLDLPTSGRMVLDGIETSLLGEADAAHVRGKKIGFIFQSFFLMPTLTASENVALPMMFQGIEKNEREKKAGAILARLGMGERFDHLPRELSGGQRQRVAIARALVNDPAIILADEPTGNLDSKSGEEVLRLFEEINKAGRTIVVVTHDMSVAKMCSRRIYLKDGMVERHG